jgi:hypothetical protein
LSRLDIRIDAAHPLIDRRSSILEMRRPVFEARNESQQFDVCCVLEIASRLVTTQIFLRRLDLAFCHFDGRLFVFESAFELFELLGCPEQLTLGNDQLFSELSEFFLSSGTRF